MKKFFFLPFIVLSFILNNHSYAQVTVTADDLKYSIGQNYQMYGRTTLYIVTGLTGKIGGPHTWNFSTGPTDINFNFDYVNPATTPCSSNYPLATVSEKRTGDGSTAYMFLNFPAGAGRTNYGICQPGVLDIPVVFNPPITDFPQNINFMDSWNGQSWFQAQSSGFDLEVNYIFTSFCNAYGTLTLPNGLGSFSCLQVSNLEHFKFYWSGFLISESYIRSFYWLIEDAGIAVIIASEESSSPPPENFDYSSIYSRMYASSKLTVSNEFSLNLKVFLEGPFNDVSGMMSTTLNPGYLPLSQPFNTGPWNYTGSESVPSIPSGLITDWILIELRDATQASLANESTIVARQAAFLLRDGTIRSLDGTSLLLFNVPISNNLFAVVRHRNHLSVMSAGPIPGFNGIFSWDYTTGAGQAHGNNALKNLTTGIFGVYAGDANADGIINLPDKSLEWEPESGSKGYIMSDLNLDVHVNNPDKDDYWFGNINKQTQVPE